MTTLWYVISINWLCQFLVNLELIIVCNGVSGCCLLPCSAEWHLHGNSSSFSLPVSPSFLIKCTTFIKTIEKTTVSFIFMFKISTLECIVPFMLRIPQIESLTSSGMGKAMNRWECIVENIFTLQINMLNIGS